VENGNFWKIRQRHTFEATGDQFTQRTGVVDNGFVWTAHYFGAKQLNMKSVTFSLPPNMTGVLQPLDVTVNKSCQDSFGTGYIADLRRSSDLDELQNPEMQTKQDNTKVPNCFKLGCKLGKGIWKQYNRQGIHKVHDWLKESFAIENCVQF
jgi:hypothetical protein